jgi:hypothetical protein
MKYTDHYNFTLRCLSYCLLTSLFFSSLSEPQEPNHDYKFMGRTGESESVQYVHRVIVPILAILKVVCGGKQNFTLYAQS